MWWLEGNDGGGRSLVVSNNGRVVEEEGKINTQSKIMIWKMYDKNVSFKLV